VICRIIFCLTGVWIRCGLWVVGSCGARFLYSCSSWYDFCFMENILSRNRSQFGCGGNIGTVCFPGYSDKIRRDGCFCDCMIDPSDTRDRPVNG